MADQFTTTRSTGGGQVADNDLTAQINAKLDEARDLMVANGMDANTANAILFGARPSDGGVIRGNLADLQRMGAIALTGEMPTPDVVADTPETNEMEAFQMPPEPLPSSDNPRIINALPPDHPVAEATAQMSETDIGLSPVSAPSTSNEQAAAQVEAAAATEAAAAEDPSASSALSGMTKAELLAEAEARGVEADESMTKAAIIEAIEGE